MDNCKAGDNTLYLNQGGNLEKIYSGLNVSFPNNGYRSTNPYTLNSNEGFGMEMKKGINTFNVLCESKHWIILQLPLTYSATNWPIRYSTIDLQGHNLAVAGRTGIAHYSTLSRKWKVFGNETQEKDFVVSGGLIYWKDFVILGCYSLIDQTDEIRCYPDKKKLDNEYGSKVQVRAPVLSLNKFRDQLIILTADGVVSLVLLTKVNDNSINMECAYEIDVKNICIHPACIVSLSVINLRNGVGTKTFITRCDEYTSETIILNVSGRILMIQRGLRNNILNSLMASCLASCVECFWTSMDVTKSPMHETLWLYSGANGMRVWLPIIPPNNHDHNATEHLHTFMSKRIMLSFPLKLYPLVILFDNVIALGVENETTLFCNELHSHFSLPFCVLEHKSQVYLHKILRQLIKRNLGYSAWQIAKSCRSLPYFFHSLELLLHEVLEDEATSKEPIPDALLPSILSFIREFPLYLKTVVQCARKTEIALWPYLFSVAGKPKDLFQQCIQLEKLDTAAGFLVILQNLEPSFISKQYAALLLDISIKNIKWDLCRDLIRFLKAIDPNEIDSPPCSMNVNVKIAPPAPVKSQVDQNAEAFNMILGPIARERSFSTTTLSHLSKEKREKPSTAINSTTPSVTTTSNTSEVVLSIPPNTSVSTKCENEIFCIKSILQHHALLFLQNFKLLQLGYLSAFLDFHLVSWLSQEAKNITKLDDFITALKCVRKELNLSSTHFTGDICSQFDIKNFEEKHFFDLIPHRFQTKSIESGYVSLTRLDTPMSELEPSNTSHTLENDGINSEHVSYIESKHNCNRLRNSILSEVFTCQLEKSRNSENHKEKFDVLPEKLAIKIRYLLQLFIEANCIDYALILSILLQDAGAIGRIINGIIRSEPLSVCCRINSGLKHLIQWSLDEGCVNRTFMISIRPHICLLEQYISSSQSSLGALTPLKSITVSNDYVHQNQGQIFAYLRQRNPYEISEKRTFDHRNVEQKNKKLQPRFLKKEAMEITPNIKNTLVKERSTCGLM